MDQKTNLSLGSLRLYSVAELINNKTDLPLVNWEVKDWVSQGGIAILSGKGFSGKTMLAISLSIHYALGRDYLGVFAIESKAERRVVYVDLESPPGLWKRKFLRICDGLGLNNQEAAKLPIHLLDRNDPRTVVDFMDKPVTDRLIAGLRPYRPTLIIIDSLGRANRGDEVKPFDMQTVFNNLDRLRNEVHCSVVLIDHHNNSNGLRGTTVKFDAVDIHIAATNHQGVIKLEQLKARISGKRFSPLRVRFQGDDDKGEPLLIERVTEIDPTRASGRNKKKSKPDLCLEFLEGIFSGDVSVKETDLQELLRRPPFKRLPLLFVKNTLRKNVGVYFEEVQVRTKGRTAHGYKKLKPLDKGLFPT